MKTMLWVVVALLPAAAGTDNLRFGGYVENGTSVMLADEESISDAASVRLEGDWDFGKRGAIETHVLLSAALQPLDPSIAFRRNSFLADIMDELEQGLMAEAADVLGQEPVDTNEVDSAQLREQARLQRKRRKQVDNLLTYLPYTSFYPVDRVLLDRALLKLYFEGADLYIGRQTIAWGTGYAFNPTDIWNRKNPLDPTAPKVGVNALRAEIPLGMLSGISLVLAPGPDFDHTSGGMRLKGNLGGFDLSISGMRIMNADRELLGLPEKWAIGADMAGQIGDVGVWTEAAVNNPVYDGMSYTDLDSLYVQADAGADYTFEWGTYVMLEYYYNGPGRGDPDDYGVRDLLYVFTGETAGFGRHYLMAGTRHTFGNYYRVSGFVLGNISDRSAMLLPSIAYDFSDNMTIELSSQIGIGDKKRTEFGAVFGNLMLTVTGYF